MRKNKILKLEGADNIRDLGGLKTIDGKIIKPNCLIRSNHLSFITDADAKVLSEEVGLTKIIDLRTQEEVDEKPDKTIPNAEWINIPVFSYSTLGVTHEEQGDSVEAIVSKLPDMVELYRTLVSNNECIIHLKEVLQVIINQTNGAVLWHCTEGKDRCGLVSAMILSMLNVPVDVIKADYLRTNKAGHKRANKYFWGVLLKTKNITLARRVQSIFVADTRFFDAAYDQIYKLYGSVEKYITNILGIDVAQQQAFKERVCI